MNIGQMLENLGLGELVDKANEHEQEILDKELEVHYQESYPLKAKVVAAGHLTYDSEINEVDDAGDETRLVIAIGNQSGNDPYGSTEAWNVGPW